MIAAQAAAMEQLWLAAARQCSLHSTTCSLHFTQQYRRGSKRLQQYIPRANQTDSSGSENKEQHSHQEIAEEILKLDPATQERLKRVGEAAALVASLQAEQAALERQIAASQRASESEARLQEQSQAQRAAERGADADIVSARQQLAAAQQELEAAMRERDALVFMSNEDAERIESAKAGVVAAAGGLLGSLPYLATAGHSLGSTAISAAQIFASCLLFGVTFRYVMAAGRSNNQLKGGAVAAFGLVRGLAYSDALQSSAADGGNAPVSASVIGASALVAGESVLTFGFAAAALEAAIRAGLVKPFGSATSA